MRNFWNAPHIIWDSLGRARPHVMSNLFISQTNCIQLSISVTISLSSLLPSSAPVCISLKHHLAQPYWRAGGGVNLWWNHALNSDACTALWCVCGSLLKSEYKIINTFPTILRRNILEPLFKFGLVLKECIFTENPTYFFFCLWDLFFIQAEIQTFLGPYNYHPRQTTRAAAACLGGQGCVHPWAG